MSILLLFLSWYLLYLVLRYIFDTGERNEDASSGETEQIGPSQDNSGYLRDVPDALRPDTEHDEFDPTDFM